MLSHGAKIKAQKGARVSLIALEEIKNITTRNLVYPLKNESLTVGQRGISNIAKGNFAVNFKQGKLLVYCSDGE